MVRAIVFDCFGVLVTESWLAFKDEHFGQGTPEAEQAAYLMQQADAGQLGHDAFIREIAGMAGISSDEVRRYLDKNTPNKPLFEYVRSELKPKYRIGMLSNAGGNWLPELFSRDQLALFDAVNLSYEVGITKPDERAYQMIADELGVEPAECVFVDDQERHCSGASETGMQAIYYQDFPRFRSDLEKIIAK